MTSPNRTYYEILGVPADASLNAIRDAYRQKAREFHPDLNPDPDAVERMQEINEAYEVLRDKEQRAAYDRAHRHFAATEGRLRQAKAEAIVIVGELAFHLGWDIGGRKGNEWAQASIGDENTPGALWAAVFEAVLESALDGGDTSSMQRAAREAAWTGAHNETARQARRHALYESAGSVTEAISFDISITVVGVLASTMGRQLGKTGTRIKPRTKAWQDVFEAAENTSLEGLSRYGDMLARGQRLRDSAFATIASHAAEAGRVALSSYAERINTKTVEQVRDTRERPWEDATRSIEHKSGLRHALRKSFAVLLLLGVLALFGGGIAASLTGTTFDDIVHSVEQFWSGSGLDVPASGPEQPDSNSTDSVAPPIVPSPTATLTATPTPTPTPFPTAAPTPTPLPVSPWAGFIITSEALGKDITERLSEEEIVCLRSSNSDSYYEYFQSEPIGVRVSMNPPVRDVTDLPALAECLSEESTQHLNLAIAIFHDPSLVPTAEPTPTPRPTLVPTSTPTPRPTSTVTPIPTSTPTPRPTATPTPRRPSDQERNYIDWTIRPNVNGVILEFAGSIQERRRQDWTLCTDGSWSSFAIYRWPPPGSSFVQRTESPVGSILEPPASGEYYSGLSADQVVADLWDVDCTSFHIRAQVSSAWPSSFRVGIRAQHQRNAAEWGLMDDERVSTS